MTGGLEFRDARGTTLACCSSERPVIQRCGLPGKGMAKWRVIRSTTVQPCTIIILSYIATGSHKTLGTILRDLIVPSSAGQVGFQDADHMQHDSCPPNKITPFVL